MNDLVRSSQLLCVGSNHSDPPVSMSLSSHSSMEEDGDQISSASDPTVSTTSSDYGNDDDEDFVDGGGDGDGDDGACNDANDQKSQNVDALVRGNLIVRRQSLLPRVLSVSDGAAVARKPFKPPCSKGYSDQNGQLTRRLWVRKRFVPWGSSKPALIDLTNRFIPFQATVKEDKEEDITLPPGVEPLVLWHPEECESGNDNLVPIVVDPLLVRFLRPHQREGVQFMFECVSGLHSADNIFGCILADDMGLGKTLQSIALLYTLLCQGFDGKPMVRKVIIVTPTSLVSNWEAEIGKWVGGRVQLIALCESSREDVISGIDHFISPRSKIQVLIVSYETFRMHASKFRHDGSCDLLICDEAHRLKNDHTLTNQALAALTCKRRILLSGTPMQNDLEEFYAMVNFTNPGILGDATHFRRHYETPIICGREPAATEEEKTLGSSRSTELSAKVNQFILRRTNALLSNHLPPKIVEVVCCKLTPLQTELYKYIIHSKNVKNAITEEARHSIILPYITGLKKLCNHPKLIYDTIKGGSSGMSCFEGCLRFFPPELFSGRSGAWTGGDGIWVELSGKMCVLARLLAHLRQKTDDRIVLVSNYTQTLDLFAQLCRERRYPFLRLDGSTSISKRQKLVNRFNDPSKDEFVFLLSSKAGGCGLNLIGGNRLVLFDPDWNPANDKQAAARVWRDGQKKRVYIYRFLSTGTIEEKVYQRQMSKEGLQKVIQQNQADNTKGNFLSTEDLRDLFTFKEDVRSEIHEKMNCTRCERNLVTSSLCEDEEERHGVGRVGPVNGSDESVLDNSDIGGFATIAGCLHKLRYSERQVGTPLEEDLCNWSHHSSPTFVPDVIFQASAGDDVTFVFANQVDGKLVPVESMAPKSQDSEAKVNQSRLENMNGKSRVLSKKPSLFSHGNVAMKTFSVPSKSETDTTMNATRSSLSNTKRLSLLSPKLSLGSQLPLKRPPQSLEDDDFQ